MDKDLFHEGLEGRDMDPYHLDVEDKAPYHWGMALYPEGDRVLCLESLVDRVVCHGGVVGGRAHLSLGHNNLFHFLVDVEVVSWRLEDDDVDDTVCHKNEDHLDDDYIGQDHSLLSTDHHTHIHLCNKININDHFLKL